MTQELEKMKAEIRGSRAAIALAVLQVGIEICRKLDRIIKLLRSRSAINPSQKRP